jgi:DNA-binding CsgD family transcriptional regulator
MKICPQCGYSEPLSDQQRKILLMCAAGLRCSQIGDKLFRSPKTIFTHIKRIKVRLDIKSPEQWMDLLVKTRQESQNERTQNPA